MNVDEVQKVKMALRYWANHHPNPDGVVLQSANGYEYTPKQIADEVAQETDFGRLQLRVIDEALSEHTLSEILEGLNTSHETHLT